MAMELPATAKMPLFFEPIRFTTWRHHVSVCVSSEEMKRNPLWALMRRRDTFRRTHDMAAEILGTHSPESLDPGKEGIMKETSKEIVP